MGSIDTTTRSERHFVWRNGRLLAESTRLMLLVSSALLAIAPLFVPDDYSPWNHTLSESGAQGVAGAFVFRSGVVLAACAVLVMTWHAGSTWSRSARRWLRIYALAVVMLAVFPESPWDAAPHDERIAFLHTVAGVVGAIAFILGVFAVSATRQRRRAFDVVVVCAVAIIPQSMLILPYDGILQRVMVALGYVWLLSESRRIVDYSPR